MSNNVTKKKFLQVLGLCCGVVFVLFHIENYFYLRNETVFDKYVKACVIRKCSIKYHRLLNQGDIVFKQEPIFPGDFVFLDRETGNQIRDLLAQNMTSTAVVEISDDKLSGGDRRDLEREDAFKFEIFFKQYGKWWWLFARTDFVVRVSYHNSGAVGIAYFSRPNTP